MVELKPCSECEHYDDCSWGWCDAIKDRYYNIRDGKEDCWTEKRVDNA